MNRRRMRPAGLRAYGAFAYADLPDGVEVLS